MLFSRPNCGLLACFVASLFVLSTPSADGADWLGFRGDGRSFAPESKPPVEFDGQTGNNIAWRTKVGGRGIGGPLVIGDQVIVTGCLGEDERDLLVESYSAATGDLQWSRPMRATGRPYTHPTSSNASPTPVSDGQRVIALFSSCDLICYDLTGKVQWYRALAVDHPKTGNDVSMSSSPVIVDGVVIVQLENQGDSFAAGIDVRTGKTLWTVDRNEGSNWSSPQAVKLDDGLMAVSMHNRESIDLLDAKTGKQLAHYDIEADGTASATFVSPYLVVPGSTTVCIRMTVNPETEPAKATDVKTSILWESNRLRPSRCSPVISDDRVYMSKGSVMVAGSLSDGSVLWQLRLGKLKDIWATPVMTGSGMYVVGSDGTVVVVNDDGSKGKVVAENQLGEKVLASPAVSGDALYFRTEKGLIKVAN